MKGLRYQTVISLQTQVGITWANTNSWELYQVSSKSKHFLSTEHTRCEHYFNHNNMQSKSVRPIKFVCHFSPYSTIVQFYDSGKFLLVEYRTQMHYTMYLERDHRPSAIKLTNFLTQSHRYEQDSNRRGLEVRGLVVRARYLYHPATEAHSSKQKICHQNRCPDEENGTIRSHNRA
jgi:hypothetical protein